MRKIDSVPLSQSVLSWNSSCKQWHASLTSMTYKSHFYSVLSFMLSLKMSKRHILIARNWENDCITTRLQTYCSTSFSISWTGMGIWMSYVIVTSNFTARVGGGLWSPPLLDNFLYSILKSCSLMSSPYSVTCKNESKAEPRFEACKGFSCVTGTSFTVGWEESWRWGGAAAFHTSTPWAHGLEKQQGRC